jgi:glycogen debranching enzyme
MGSLSKWPDFFKVFSSKGYNMIHFTPLNHRGDSNSPYSIYNQLAFSPDLFDKGTNIEDQHVKIREMTSSMEKEFGLLSLTDVVWNHTAENSDWLQDHPEAAYNLYNSPHLIAAYELDTSLLEFSSNLRHLGYPTSMNSMDDLLRIMDGIKTHVLGSLRLWEFYILDVAPTVASILAAWEGGAYDHEDFSGVDFRKMSLKRKAEVVSNLGLKNASSLGNRFQKTLDSFVGSAYLYHNYGEYHDSNVVAAQRDLTNLINEINLPFYRQFDLDREAILENIFNRVKYVRLDLKKGEISEEYDNDLT